MKTTISIKTQEEYDNLPQSFEEETSIWIISKETITVEATGNSQVVVLEDSRVVAKGNSHVEARDNSHVEARDNSRVEAWDNSLVEARDNSSVVAGGNSSVNARGNSSVVAKGNTHVNAGGNSYVVARGNSSVHARYNTYVVARDNSLVEARDNSRVEAWDNTRVVAMDNSLVVAMDNTSVDANGSSNIVACDNSKIKNFEYSITRVYSSHVTIEMMLDYSNVILHGMSPDILEKSETALLHEPPDYSVPFEEWLRRGYVVADGIRKKLISRRTVGDLEVFKVEEFGTKSHSFVVKSGEFFSHGKTFKEAANDLKFKISDRDTSKYDYLKEDLDKEISEEEAIRAYRTVTGACEHGVKDFISSIQVPKVLTPNVIIEITKTRFGSSEFKSFLYGEKFEN